MMNRRKLKAAPTMQKSEYMKKALYGHTYDFPEGVRNRRQVSNWLWSSFKTEMRANVIYTFLAITFFGIVIAGMQLILLSNITKDKDKKAALKYTGYSLIGLALVMLARRSMPLAPFAIFAIYSGFTLKKSQPKTPDPKEGVKL